MPGRAQPYPRTVPELQAMLPFLGTWGRITDRFSNLALPDRPELDKPDTLIPRNAPQMVIRLASHPPQYLR
jgi:hypothetical protein